MHPFAFLLVLLAASISLAAEPAPLTSQQSAFFRKCVPDMRKGANDLKALNYALTLEHLEATFYTQGLTNFSALDFTNAGYNAAVYSYITLIKDHELAHVNALNATIILAGGSPVPACQYNFQVTNVNEFLATARVFENVGVTAYDGAVNSIANEMLLTVAATVATVEARHAAYLNNLLGSTPFPAAFDNATAPSIIVSTVSPFITSCPYTLDSSVLPMPISQLVVATVAAGGTRPPVVVPAASSANDIKALNYALTLEFLEATFYAQGMQNFSLADFTNAGYNMTVYSYFILIRDHEAAHVATLNSTIVTLGGVPVKACIYNFGVTTVQQFVTLAQTLENTGVRAYAGAVNTINNEDLLTVAATIATVEARHAAYLNALVDASPFPDSFDNATVPGDIVTAITPLIVSCPVSLNAAALPVPLASLPRNTASPTGSPTPSPTNLITTAFAASHSACVLLVAILGLISFL